ncbi:MAG: hypothetical protein ACJ77K_12620 [Bacteroidia bacterium]
MFSTLSRIFPGPAQVFPMFGYSIANMAIYAASRRFINILQFIKLTLKKREEKMKTDKGGNSREDSVHTVNHDQMRETSKLQGRNSSDGREETYKTKGEEKTEAEGASIKNDSTGRSDQEDVKKEFEIRSGKSKEEKREKDPAGELEENHGEEKDQSPGWRRSYKGDAELVP